MTWHCATEVAARVAAFLTTADVLEARTIA
jgi:hypothetical protein